MTNDILEVPRRWLLIALSTAWGIGALLLCFRSARWMKELTTTDVWVETLVIVFVAGVFYRFVLSTVVVRAVERIHRLPARVSVFRAFTLRSVLLIAIMVGLGMTLRSMEIPPSILLYPYATMGVALLTGALQLFRASLAHGIPETS